MSSNSDMWSEFNRIMALQAERKQHVERYETPEEWEQVFMDGLVVEFRPSVFLEEVRQIKRERELIAEGVKLCVVGYVAPDDRPVSLFASQFIQFLKEQ